MDGYTCVAGSEIPTAAHGRDHALDRREHRVPCENARDSLVDVGEVVVLGKGGQHDGARGRNGSLHIGHGRRRRRARRVAHDAAARAAARVERQREVDVAALVELRGRGAQRAHGDRGEARQRRRDGRLVAAEREGAEALLHHHGAHQQQHLGAVAAIAGCEEVEVASWRDCRLEANVAHAALPAPHGQLRVVAAVERVQAREAQRWVRAPEDDHVAEHIARAGVRERRVDAHARGHEDVRRHRRVVVRLPRDARVDEPVAQLHALELRGRDDRREGRRRHDLHGRLVALPPERQRGRLRGRGPARVLEPEGLRHAGHEGDVEERLAEPRRVAVRAAVRDREVVVQPEAHAALGLRREVHELRDRRRQRAGQANG